MIRILCSLALLVSTIALADMSKDKQYFYIYHINGVNTKYNEAMRNLNMLYSTANVQSNIIKWDVLYNPTHGVMSDLYDVWRQKKQESQSITLDTYIQNYMKDHGLVYAKNSPEYEALKIKLKDNYAKDPAYVGRNFDEILHQFYNKTETDNPAHFLSIANELKNRDVNKTFVLLLPHSQGNLYANSLVDYLAATGYRYVDNIGIATPADHTSRVGFDSMGSAPFYVTAKNDDVINGLRKVSDRLGLKRPLRSNVTLSVCGDKNRCHALIDAYLMDEYAVRMTSFNINNDLGVMLRMLKTALLTDDAGVRSPQIYFQCQPYWNSPQYNNVDDLCGADMGIGEKKLCIDGKCDPGLFGYVYQSFPVAVPPPYPAELTTLKITFSLPGALKPGKYWLAGSTPRNGGYRFSFYSKNQLMHLYRVALSSECYSAHSPISACVVNEDEIFDSWDYFSLTDTLLEKDATLTCQRFPSLCSGTKLIFGGIRLG